MGIDKKGAKKPLFFVFKFIFYIFALINLKNVKYYDNR